MGRLLCLIGLHSWRALVDEDLRYEYRGDGLHFIECRRCGKTTVDEAY